jgi:UDP-glucuronate decarboxylase
MTVILITGGCGFLAKNLIINLLKNPENQILCLDNFITSNKDDFKDFTNKYDINNKVLLFECDITDLEKMTYIKLNHKLDEIYHFASLASPIYYKKNPLQTLDVGYIGTKNVLDLMLFQNSVGDAYTQNRNVKMLYSSTSEVYGEATESPQQETYLGNVNSFGVRACFSQDTEILTETGFKNFEDISMIDKVATLNQDTQNLEYYTPNKIIKEKFKGNLLHFINTNIDIEVTPNHNMYLQKEKSTKFELLKAHTSLDWNSVYLKKRCDYQCEDTKFFELFGNVIDMDLWLKFIGYFIANGFLNTTRKEIYIKGFSPKIDKCLANLNVSYTYSDDIFKINNDNLFNYLFRFKEEKYIPRVLMNVSPRQIKLLLNALMLNTMLFTTRSFKLVSNIQELLIKTNSFGNISTNSLGMYYIKFNNTCKMYKYSKPINKPYDGFVYCVNVTNSVILVRRNGKAFFCGNCYDESKRVGEALCYTYLNSFSLDIKIARIFNTYGPYMLLNDGRIVTECIKHLINNTVLTIYGDGLQTRSLSYVLDTINQLVLLMQSDSNTPVNIGNDEEVSINNLVNIIETEYNGSVQKQYIPLTQNDPIQRQPCLKLNESILGIIEKTDLVTGIQKTIEYFKK